LGIYPTVETLAAQAVVLLALFAATIRSYGERWTEVGNPR